MTEVLLKTDLKGYGTKRQGKVRDIYDMGKHLLLIATDRISAFDVVLPNGIPSKGKILTEISRFWLNSLAHIIPNHCDETAETGRFMYALYDEHPELQGRTMLVKKAKPFATECIVRGYLSGSALKEYKKLGTVCGAKLPEGLVESSKLPIPIFTPSTKAAEGHDINITYEEFIDIIGESTAFKLSNKSLSLYMAAQRYAESKGIIIADTKFEFGLDEDGNIILIDEALTPDSSRFWSMETYAPGRSQDSMDKQIVRDYLETLDWDKTPPGPVLPDDIVAKLAARYQEIFDILTA